MALILDINTSNEWHVLKGETQYGPYTYEEILRMMQNNIVFNFDYVWSPHMDTWTQAADLTEFSADRILRVIEQNPEDLAFAKRSSERVACNLPIYVNDNRVLWEGNIQSLSHGGALVFMKNPVLLPGNHVQMHFRQNDSNDLAFNCRVEIINKKLSKQRIQHDTGIFYVVKFITKNNPSQEQIIKLVQKFKSTPGAA